MLESQGSGFLGLKSEEGKMFLVPSREYFSLKMSGTFLDFAVLLPISLLFSASTLHWEQFCTMCRL